MKYVALVLCLLFNNAVKAADLTVLPCEPVARSFGYVKLPWVLGWPPLEYQWDGFYHPLISHFINIAFHVDVSNNECQIAETLNPVDQGWALGQNNAYLDFPLNGAGTGGVVFSQAATNLGGFGSGGGFGGGGGGFEGGAGLYDFDYPYYPDIPVLPPFVPSVIPPQLSPVPIPSGFGLFLMAVFVLSLKGYPYAKRRKAAFQRKN